MVKKTANIDAEILRLQEKIARIKADITCLHEKLALANTEEMAARLECSNALQRWHTHMVNSHEEIEAAEMKVQPLSARSSDIRTRIMALEKDLDEALKEEKKAKNKVVK